MALSLFARNRKVINIEIKDYVIRFVDVKQGKQPSLHKCGEYLLPQGIIRNGKIIDFETLKMILAQCIEDWKIARREVRFLLPDESIFMRKIQIPPEIEADEIEGYIYLQLGSSIHLPFENPYFDFYMLDEVNGEKEIILFAAPEELVEQYTNLLEECKLRPVVADLSALALYRFYHTMEEVHTEAPLLLLHISLFDVNASVFVEDKPQFIRNISIPVEQELWERAESRKGEQEWIFTNEQDVYMQMFQDIFIEVDRVLSFFKFNMNQGNQEVSKIVITGDHPFIHNIITSFRERYEFIVKEINDEKLIVDEPNIHLSSFYLPIGLSLRGGK